jgi:hypothetical protein
MQAGASSLGCGHWGLAEGKIIQIFQSSSCDSALAIQFSGQTGEQFEKCLSQKDSAGYSWAESYKTASGTNFCYEYESRDQRTIVMHGREQ